MALYREQDWLMHEGNENPGRYPRGSGERPYQHMSQFRAKRLARKDAKEYARAKMFYGEGAGNRRKLINATVNERSKDTLYKEYFDRYLSKQNMDEHAAAAKRERTRKDVGKAAGKTARGVYHTVMRDGAKVATSVAIGYAVLRMTGMDTKIGQALKSGYEIVKYSVKTKLGQTTFQDVMKRYGGTPL